LKRRILNLIYGIALGADMVCLSRDNIKSPITITVMIFIAIVALFNTLSEEG